MRRIAFACVALVSTGCAGLLGLDEFTGGEGSTSGGGGTGPTTTASTGDATTSTTTTADTTSTGPGGGDGGAGSTTTGPGGGDGGSGGNGGAGGEEPIDCPPDRGDCDGDNIDCETTIRDNVEHCGACFAPCDGVCAGVECSAFEVIEEGIDGPFDRGIAFTDTDLYWVGATDPNENTYFVHKSPKAAIQVTSLAANLDRITYIEAGSQRLYFGSINTVVDSMRFDGGDYVNEEPYASNAVFSDNILHHVENYNGATYLLWKNVLTNTSGTTYQITGQSSPPWMGQDIGPTFLSDSGYMHFPLGRFDATNQTYSYALYYTHYSGGTPTLLVSETQGSIEHMRQSFGDIYWIESPNGEGDQLLKAFDGTQVRVVTQATRIHSFAADGNVVFVGFSQDGETPTRGVRIVNQSSQQSIELLPGTLPRSIAIDGPYIYFFEAASRRLLRIQLPNQN